MNTQDSDSATVAEAARAETVGMSTDSDRAVEMRHALVDQLLADAMITTSVVERVFRKVPRHLFVAEGTSLEVAYNAADSVPIKKNADGVTLSSTSAPFIQAQMIEQAGLGPGMSVLEIGSGGYNAALLAEVVGPQGRVVSVDIDPEVTDRTRALLEATGYGDRVTMVKIDADYAVPELHEPVDAILVTVGAWDLAPAWCHQLASHGVLVVPLRMNGVTRSIAFRREGEHWASTSAEVCGFVAMQGIGAHDERTVRLSDARGHHVTLRFDGDVWMDPRQLGAVLDTKPTDVWSGVTVGHNESFAELHLWFASFLPGFCKLDVDEGTDLTAHPQSWFPFGAARDDSFAYLVVRPVLDGAGVEFGARAYGTHRRDDIAAGMVAHIQAWDRRARNGPAPTFTYWPTDAGHPEPSHNTAVLEKTHGMVAITWPPLD